MSIAQSTIDEIRNSADIIEIIGKEVRLIKKGKSFKGLCPFHSEKTPSFTVNAEKGLFYCFGCHKGGDSIKFVIEFYKLSYVDALEMLAEKFGIKIIRTSEKLDSAEENEKIFGMLNFTAEHFHAQLYATEEGKIALEYLYNRKLSDETIEYFKIGYSQKSWDELIQSTEVEGISKENLLKIGLIKQRDDESFYDTFRGRIMFPIHSTMGRIIGFGARKMFEDDPLGKYINSSDSIIYQKSKILYGLNFSKDEIRHKNSVLLVEGYMDYLALFQSGFKNVVATSGTALTQPQIQILARYTTNIFFVFDGDTAGSSAMLRGIDLILQSGLDVRIIELPPGLDPDNFINQMGKEEFQNLLSKAISFIEFKANNLQKQGKLNSAEGKAEAVREIVNSISKIKDPLRKTFFIKEVAGKYDLYESMLLNELEKLLDQSKSSRYQPTSIYQENLQAETILQQSEGEVKVIPKNIPIEEKEILSSMLENPEKVCPFVFSQINADEFTHPISIKLADLIFHLRTEGETISINAIYNLAIEEEVKIFVTELSAMQYQLGDEWNKIGSRLSEERLLHVAFGAIKKIKIKKLEIERDKNQSELKSASINNIDPSKYLIKHKEILQKIKSVQDQKLEK
ncbi:MAG: DNA primase [Bacteroidetes bacterium]|nr:DNA primase [Bacteroidota bacterium]